MDKQFIYTQRKSNSTVIWILFLLLGWSYGSLDKVGIQILYYITLGGLGIWAIIRLFTLNKAIRKYNAAIAKDLGFSTDDMSQMGLIK